MSRILTLVLIAIVALTALSFTIHFLFSPWLLVAIAILAVDQVPPAPLPPVVPDPFRTRAFAAAIPSTSIIIC